jgi:hypothetical protein
MSTPRINESAAVLTQRWDALATEREKAVQLGGRHEHFLATSFTDCWGDFLMALRDAIALAESGYDAPAMRKLVPLLEGTTRAIGQLRRLADDRLNSPESNHILFLRCLDNSVAPPLKALLLPAQPPKIESPKQMQKAMNSPTDPPERWISAIQNTWPHIDRMRLVAILCGDEPDILASEHPDVVAWNRQQEEFPTGWDDSLLAGECRQIEVTRQRHGRPAVTA